MAINYLIKDVKDDIVFEDQMACICLHFQSILYIEKKDIFIDIFIDIFEILGILVRLLGTPVSRKLFQNSF